MSDLRWLCFSQVKYLIQVRCVYSIQTESLVIKLNIVSYEVRYLFAINVSYHAGVYCVLVSSKSPLLLLSITVRWLFGTISHLDNRDTLDWSDAFL